MSKETCETCEHSCNTHFVKGRGPSNTANHICLVLGSLIPDWWYEDNPNCGGGYWSERTDSLEQILNEAVEGCDELLGMFDNMNSNGLLQYGCYSQMFEQLCCINERIETARDMQEVDDD